MFEKTREIVRKDRYGFPEEEGLPRSISLGNPHASLSRKELSWMTGCEPILAGDIQANPAYDRRLPPSQENFLFTVTVTADLLGGTRNLIYDGTMLYLVHGERKYRLSDEGLIRKRAAQLEVKARELSKIFESFEESVLQAVIEARSSGLDRSSQVLSR